MDRRALPAPEGRQVEVAYVAPRNAVEEVVAGIWPEVLGVDRVGVEDDFFELGGHSLLATQVMARLRESFDVDVPLRALFEVPSVGGLSERVTALRSEGIGVEAPPLESVVRDGDLPLSFFQERLWFLDQLEGLGSAYNVPAAACG